MNTNEKENVTPEIELIAEEIEAVIAPGLKLNHSETLGIELAVEEAEEVIAPGVALNHSETLLVARPGR